MGCGSKSQEKDQPRPRGLLAFKYGAAIKKERKPKDTAT